MLNILRIAFVTPLPPVKGGISRFSHDLAGALHEQQGVCLRLYPFRRLYPRLLFSGRSFAEPLPGADISFPGQATLELFRPLSWLRCARDIRSDGHDVVVVSFWSGLLAPLSVLMAVMTGLPVVILMHNYRSHERLLDLPLLKRLMLKRSAGVVTLSGYVHRQVASDYPGLRSRRLFHPVYESQPAGLTALAARKRLGIERHDGPVLLFFGYVRHYKGLDVLVRAMPHLASVFPGVQLVIAGEFFEPVERYRSLVSSVGAGPHVRMLPGFVHDEMVSVVFMAADAVVLPYRRASQSGVVQQAYGYERPVIVSRAGGLSESVVDGKTGSVVDASLPGLLASGIIRFFGSWDRERSRRAIRAYRQQHSWERLASGCADFLREVVDERC